MTMKFIIYTGHLVLWQWNSGKYDRQNIQLGLRRQRIHIAFGRKPSWEHTNTWRWNPSGMLQTLPDPEDKGIKFLQNIDNKE